MISVVLKLSVHMVDISMVHPVALNGTLSVSKLFNFQPPVASLHNRDLTVPSPPPAPHFFFPPPHIFYPLLSVFPIPPFSSCNLPFSPSVFYARLSFSLLFLLLFSRLNLSCYIRPFYRETWIQIWPSRKTGSGSPKKIDSDPNPIPS